MLNKEQNPAIAQDELLGEVFTCMQCNRQFTVEEGTWPQYNSEGEMMLDADLNNRTRDEFCCYDCAG